MFKHEDKPAPKMERAVEAALGLVDDESVNQFRRKAYTTLNPRYDGLGVHRYDWFLNEIYGDHFIVHVTYTTEKREGGTTTKIQRNTHERIDFTVDASGVITLGDVTEVEFKKMWVPVSSGTPAPTMEAATESSLRRRLYRAVLRADLNERANVERAIESLGPDCPAAVDLRLTRSGKMFQVRERLQAAQLL
ncbi:MAG: hypothetical protein ACE366_16450 [Bradymonadia bacterium]